MSTAYCLEPGGWRNRVSITRACDEIPSIIETRHKAPKPSRLSIALLSKCAKYHQPFPDKAPFSESGPHGLILSAMMRHVVITLVLSLLSSGTAIAQVKIIVPEQRYKPEERIRAIVENNGTNPVTICVEFGQTSSKGEDIESTPMPFYVQAHDAGGWGMPLLIGPDIGSIRRAVVMEGGKKLEFPFRLKSIGEMRLRLKYWIGSKQDQTCTERSKGGRLATSASFTVE